MKFFISLLTLLLCHVVFAQGEANNWYFGNNAGIKFNADGIASPLTGGKTITTEGCSSISNAEGHLLFYTDGRNVWDKDGTKMPNGNYDTGTGLLGDPSSTQSGIIVPKKGDPNIYYIFTVDEPHHQNAAAYPNQFLGIYDEGSSVPGADDGFNNGLNYSIIDLSVTGTNGSIGDVTTRNVHLITYDPTSTDELSYKCSEKITAVKTTDGTGFWVITQFRDNFYAFKVDATGVNTTPVVTNIAPLVPTAGYRRNSIGYLKASPNGKKLAIAHNQIGSVPGAGELNGVVYIYDFDAATGVVTNAIEVQNGSNPYGIEFSSEASKLYVSYSGGGGLDGVWQYNMLAANISASGIQVGFTGNNSGALQLGPNGKIYKARSGSRLDVINDPEADGTACNYVANGQLVAGQSTLGLPPFITSLFSANISVTNTCFGQATQLELNTRSTFDSVVWDFGDSTPTSNAITPTHTYATTGTYNVTATVTKNSEVSVITGSAIISVIPVANTAPAIIECDADNNGTESFTLSGNTASILGSQTAAGFEIKYYKSQPDADADVMALNENSYTNTNTTETIYARIQNKANPLCYATTSFTITALGTPSITQFTANTCDDNTDGDDSNGRAITDLNNVTQQMLPGNTQFSVKYYIDSTDAGAEQSVLPVQYYNTAPNQQVIYARITNIANPTCFGIVPVTINVIPVPAPPAAPVTLVQCDLGVAPDGLTTFNLRQADAQLTGGVTGVTVRYFTSAAIAQTGSGELGDLFTNTSNPQVITARIENAATGCYRLEQVTLQATFSPRPQVTLEECDDDGNEDGLRQFNLDDAGVATGTETVVYYTSENDALAEINPIPALFTTTVANQQTVFARIENNNDCIAIQQIQLIVRRMPNITTVGEGLVCLNTNEFITLTNGLPGSTTGYAFEWSTLETTPTIRVNKPGVYTVKVTDMTNTAGCSKLRTITVTASDIANITDINIQDLQRNNIVTVTAVPNNAGVVTTYLYSLDAPNGPYQASNVFENVTAGMHTVYVYDDNGCGVVHQDISVLEIPKFFTPNADGINDTWNIIGVNALFYAKSKIYVFDRFGKLLADVDPRGLGWDGQHDGRRLPATDYWYVVELDNGRTVKGHFSLIR